MPPSVYLKPHRKHIHTMHLDKQQLLYVTRQNLKNMGWMPDLSRINACRLQIHKETVIHMQSVVTGRPISALSFVKRLPKFPDTQEVEESTQNVFHPLLLWHAP